MISRILLFLFVSFFFSNCKPQAYFDRPQNFTTNPNYRGTAYFQDLTTCPSPKVVEQINGSLITERSLKVIENDWSHEIHASVQLVNRKIAEKQNSQTTSGFLKLRLQKIKNEQEIANRSKLKAWQIAAYYELLVSPDEVVLRSTTKKGANYGLASLLCLLEKPFLFSTNVIDWPDLKERHFQVVLKDMDPSLVAKVIESAWRQKYNGLLITVYNGVDFLASKQHNRISAMSVNDFQKLVKYARDLNLKVVPHFDFLTHQDESFFQQDVDSSLLYNRRTLNPDNEKVYDIIFSLIDEVDSLVSPAAIHIGHDEVMGFTPKQVEEYGPILPANLFLKNVRRLHSYLKSKGIETQMWGDMLLHKSDYPDMHPSSVNAVSEYQYLSDSLPKEIVITDWHYLHYKWRIKKGPLSFASTDHFAKNGHKVLCATFKWNYFNKEYARYVYQKAPSEVEGMIATTWHELLNGTFFKKNDQMEVFYTIMSESAENYWNASTK